MTFVFTFNIVVFSIQFAMAIWDAKKKTKSSIFWKRFEGITPFLLHISFIPILYLVYALYFEYTEVRAIKECPYFVMLAFGGQFL